MLVLEFASMCLMIVAAGTEGEPGAVITLSNGTCCCRCIFFLPILIQAIRIATQVDEVELMIEQAARDINGCSDEYTVLDTDLNKNEMAYI